jgi:hypothetical protein
MYPGSGTPRAEFDSCLDNRLGVQRLVDLIKRGRLAHLKSTGFRSRGNWLKALIPPVHGYTSYDNRDESGRNSHYAAHFTSPITFILLTT